MTRHPTCSSPPGLASSGSEETVYPVSDLAAYVADNPVHAVWIAVPWEDKHTLDESLHALRESVVDVNVVPDLEQYRLLNQGISEWGGLPVISLSGTPMTGSERRLKNLFDWLGAFVLLRAAFSDSCCAGAAG